MIWLIVAYGIGVLLALITAFVNFAYGEPDRTTARIILAAPVWPIALIYKLFKTAFGKETE